MNRADPDSFVVLFPVPWGPDQTDALRETHAQHWQEEIAWTVEPADGGDADVTATGAIEGPDDKRADLVVEQPIEELVEAAGTSKEPYTASERARLENHSAIWRVTVEGGNEEGLEQAVWTTQLMSTFVEAGAAGAFLPAIIELHPPSFVQNQSMSIGHIQPVVNLFVSAWDDEDWMATRGLTAFGLPELETPVAGGLNAAYFRLMDIASGMINNRQAFPTGADVEIGPESYVIEEGRQGPEDEQVPLSGHFGVLTVRDRDGTVQS